MWRINEILKGLVNLLLFIAGSLLGLRFILKLFSANATNDFVDWVYRTSADILTPFRNIFTPTTTSGGYTIEFSTLFALLVYGLLGIAALALIDVLTPTDEPEERKSVRSGTKKR